MVDEASWRTDPETETEDDGGKGQEEEEDDDWCRTYSNAVAVNSGEEEWEKWRENARNGIGCGCPTEGNCNCGIRGYYGVSVGSNSPSPPRTPSPPRAAELWRTWMQIVEEDAEVERSANVEEDEANVNEDANVDADVDARGETSTEAETETEVGAGAEAGAEVGGRVDAFKGVDIATALKAIDAKIAVVSREIEELKQRKRRRELQRLPVAVPQWLQEAIDNEEDDDPYRNYTRIWPGRMTASRITTNFASSLRLAQTRIFNARYNYEDTNNYSDNDDNDNSSSSDNDNDNI